MNFVTSLSFERQSFDNIKSATTIIDAHDLFSFLFLFSVTFTNIHANFKTVFTFEVLQSFFLLYGTSITTKFAHYLLVI